MTMPDKEDRTIPWDDLLAAYTEWFDATVERLGGIEKFIFRVAHRSRRLDTYSELPTLWMAAMDRIALERVTDSVRGYPDEHGMPSEISLPPLNSTIREAVGELLQGVARDALSDVAAEWGKPSELVATIVNRSEYLSIDASSSNTLALLETGLALLDAGEAEQSLPYFANSRLSIGLNVNDQIDAIGEYAGNAVNGMHLIRDQWQARYMDATIGFVRALIAAGKYDDAAAVVEESIIPGGPGSGVDFDIPDTFVNVDLDYTYWQSHWRRFAASIYENALFRADVWLQVFHGELLARKNKVADAIEVWTPCLDCAQDCAAADRPDLAVAITASFQRFVGIRGADLKRLVRNPRGIATLSHALELRKTFEAVPERHARHFGPNGWITEDISDIEAEIIELQLSVGRGNPYSLYDYSLAMRDSGSVTIANALLEQAAEYGHGLAMLESGIKKLSFGDEATGLKYLESAALDEDIDEAVHRIVSWAKTNKDLERLQKWLPRQSKLIERERQRL